MTMLQVDRCFYSTFLLEIKIERNRSVELFPCLFEAHQSIRAEAAKHRNGIRIEYIFKVTGEETILLLVKVLEIYIIEALISAIGEALQGGVTFSVSCVPLRSYDTFAHKVLGVDKKVSEPETTLSSSGQLYWWDFDIEFEGISFESFMSNWREEAAAKLELKCSLELNMDLYKVVAERKVHCFINTSNQEELDLLTFQLPIMKTMGEHVKIRCKSIQHFDDFLSENSYVKSPLKRFIHWCHHFKGSC